jgi:hypothetical protein
MTWTRILVALGAGATVALLLAAPSRGAERMVVGEYFTATW